MTLFKKKKQRPSLFSKQSYDAEAHKTEQPFVYEGEDVGWTTSDYPVPKDFLQFYHIDFAKQAASMLNAVDEGVPHYEIISRKKVTRNCHKRELEAIKAEKARVEAIVEEIGGYDYEC